MDPAEAQVLAQLYEQASQTVGYLERLATQQVTGAQWHARRLTSVLRMARECVPAARVLPKSRRDPEHAAWVAAFEDYAKAYGRRRRRR